MTLAVIFQQQQDLEWELLQLLYSHVLVVEYTQRLLMLVPI